MVRIDHISSYNSFNCSERSQKYQDFIRAVCGPERDADWTREAGAVLTWLDTIIGTAFDPFQFTTKQEMTKLDVMVNLNKIEQ